MALNTDFKVKDSLYVGNSACFVTQTDTPRILSAGEDLLTVFVQQGEIVANCTLSNGTAIGTFSYDGTADVCVNVDATCNTTWNSAYTTTQSNSANWNEAYTWCTTNGDNVIDTVAEGNAQGRIAVTDIGNTTTQVDVNGLQTNDSPQFAGLCTTGSIAVDGTVDGRDVAADGITLDTLQSLSADQSLTFSSPSQGTLRITDADSDVTDIDLGVQTGDNVQFAGGCYTGSITVDGTVDGRDVANDGTTLDTLRSLSGANIDSGSSPSQGTVRLTSADGSNTDIDTGLQTGDTPTFDGVNLCGLSNVVDNTILTINGSGSVGTDEVDGKIFGTALVDGEGTSGFVPKYTNGTGTIGDSIIREDGNGDIQIGGGLSATGVLSGDGSGLTNITADNVDFPTNAKTDLAAADKFYIEDSSDSSAKHVTYSNLLTDLAGTNMGLEVDNTDSLALKNYCNLTTNKVSKWDATNGQFVDSIITEDSGATCINIAGNVTITDNLSVLGTFTCLDTNVSVSSALSVVNAGTGPALYVEQTGIGQPIAEFKDTEGGTMIIGDTGDVGIGIIGSDPGEKLTVSGNISANGTLHIDGASNIDGTATFNSGVNFCGVTAGTDNTVLVQNADGSLATDEIDSKVWDGNLVDYCGSSTGNAIPKFTDTTGTIDNSNISDNGSVVTINSDTVIDSTHSFQVKAAASTYSETAAFTDLVSNTGTVVTTFNKTNLKSATYHVTLVNGVNVTTFDVNAVYNGTDPCGTVYGIVDAQAASQLNDIAITDAGSTIELSISSTAASTTAIIEGTALYTS